MTSLRRKAWTVTASITLLTALSVAQCNRDDFVSGPSDRGIHRPALSTVPPGTIHAGQWAVITLNSCGDQGCCVFHEALTVSSAMLHLLHRQVELVGMRSGRPQNLPHGPSGSPPAPPQPARRPVARDRGAGRPPSWESSRDGASPAPTSSARRRRSGRRCGPRPSTSRRSTCPDSRCAGRGGPPEPSTTSPPSLS